MLDETPGLLDREKDFVAILGENDSTGHHGSSAPTHGGRDKGAALRSPNFAACVRNEMPLRRKRIPTIIGRW